MDTKKFFWPPVLGVAAVKLIFHLLYISRYGFHRDEFLYQALGRHPDFGFWSNPPLIGWMSWLTQHSLGSELWAMRLPSVLTGCALVLVAGLMAREMGGGRYAQLLAGLGILFSPAYLRSSHMFQPVVFDILFWSLMTLILLRYLNRQRPVYLYQFAVVFALGFLNKYSVVFLLLALVGVLLLSKHRQVLWSKHAGGAALLATSLLLPNLLWQFREGFPVVTHLSELAENQLGNVTVTNFLIDQIFMNFPGLILWLPGLWWLLRAKESTRFRLAGHLYLAVLLLFILLSGKSYYTLGLYPMLLSAGAVAWSEWASRFPVRTAIPALMLLLLLPILPLGVPVLPLKQLSKYCQSLINIGFEAPMRWEDGRIHPLPQDYADMLGWKEFAPLVAEAIRAVPEGTTALLYCENYGQAGAIDHYGHHWDLPPAVSFADSYRLWIPLDTGASALIYVNNELGEDVDALFDSVRLIGTISTPLAREYGTQVYLCEQPNGSFGELWRERVEMVTQ